MKVSKFLQSVMDTLERKNNSYGNCHIFAENMKERLSGVFSEISKEKFILIMLELKIERLSNLLQNNSEIDIMETFARLDVKDTLIDICGYACILNELLQQEI